MRQRPDVIDPNWRLRATVIANSQTYDAGLLSAATADDSGNVGNAPWFIHSPSNGRNVAVDLTGHVRTGDIGHTILVGTDYYDLSFSYIGYVAGFSVVDTIERVQSRVLTVPTGAGSFGTYTNAPPDWHTKGTQGSDRASTRRIRSSSRISSSCSPVAGSTGPA